MAKLNTIGKIIAVILLLSCTHKTDNALMLQAISDTIPGTPAYIWKQDLPFGSGSFPEEYKPGTFPLGLSPVQGIDGKLWMLWHKYAWSSVDGLTWTGNSKTDWGERISTSIVYFQNKLWMTGGMRYKERKFMNDIWSSSDGKTWVNAGNAGWSPRKGHTVTVFKEKLWLFGGADGIASDITPNKFLDDIWSSTDGLHWNLVTNAAPWPAVDNPNVVVKNDTMFLLGGNGYAGVWKSGDGINWEQLKNEAEWKPRFFYGALVYDQKMWVFGGNDTSSNHNLAAQNDVWFSENGKDWQMQVKHAPWTVRSGATSIVFKDKLWIYSGKHTGGKYNWGGDIWTMRKIN